MKEATKRLRAMAAMLMLAGAIAPMACAAKGDDAVAEPPNTVAEFCKQMTLLAAKCTGKAVSPTCSDGLQAQCILDSQTTDAMIEIETGCGVPLVPPDCACFTAGEESQCADEQGAALTEANTCVQSGITMLEPTAAQSSLKDAFCGWCPDGASTSAPTACADFFSASLTSVNPITLSDGVAAQAVTVCTIPGEQADPDAGDCAATFASCIQTVLDAPLDNPGGAPASCQ